MLGRPPLLGWLGARPQAGLEDAEEVVTAHLGSWAKVVAARCLSLIGLCQVFHARTSEYEAEQAFQLSDRTHRIDVMDDRHAYLAGWSKVGGDVINEHACFRGHAKLGGCQQVDGRARLADSHVA